MAATTMPTVLLGGDPAGTQDEVFAPGKPPSPCPACRASPSAAPSSTPGRRRCRRRSHRGLPSSPHRSPHRRNHGVMSMESMAQNAPNDRGPGRRRYLSKQYTVDSIDGLDYRERLIPGRSASLATATLPASGRPSSSTRPHDPTIMPYYQGRNEQAQSHQAVGYARHTTARQTFAISTSIGPGSSNLLTGAALATTNRLPVLLLPSDTFATRAADPVLPAARAALRLRHHGQRRLPAAVQVLRPRQPARTAVLRVPPRPPRPDEYGRNRRRHHALPPRTSRPKPLTCPRNSWPNGSGASAAPTPTTRTSAAPPKRSGPQSAR